VVANEVHFHPRCRRIDLPFWVVVFLRLDPLALSGI
jgi:hypothetical protein